MNTEVYDILFRSRKTLLSILDKKGYDVTPYEKFGPWEIESMIQSDVKNSLHMHLVQKKESNTVKNCFVIYRLKRLKQSLAKFFQENFIDETSEHFIQDVENTEVIVILLEPVNTVDAFHAFSLQAYSTNKLRLSFFQADSLVNDPSQHILVPKHEIVPYEEVASLKKLLNIQSVSNLPFIRFHQDIQARLIGAVPGDIIKITRPSPSSGVEIMYRVCVA
jgi:DNA-directed RNA polymerase subunit H|uniref:RNA polymerase subunit H/Rpb5 C-terminal domain-containing protein n=1 Tax=viral metagenome TaxID=1070528 RepID=A0A6C0IF32_9ZZZZ